MANEGLAFYDTEQREGEGQREASGLELWLKQNNLNELIPVFCRESNLTLEDIVDMYHFGDFEIFCADYKMENALQIRLVSKIKRMDAMAVQPQVIRVVISEQEQSAMDKLKEIENALDDALKANTQKTETLLEEMEATDAEIDAVFGCFMQRVQERQKSLKDALSEQSGKQMDALKE